MLCRSHPRIFVTLALFPLLLSLSACIGGRSAPAQYQLLAALAEKNIEAPLAGKSVGIGPVQVAQFLQRPQIVTHTGSTQMFIDDNVRWGEPLEQGVQRVLLQNIALLTGAETRNFPWRQNVTPDYALRIDVIDLDKLPNGESLLAVNWMLEDLKNARVIKTQQETIRSKKNYDDLLAQLAQHVATTLNNPQ